MHAITNTLPMQAPWGGIERLLGNQAYAISCPGGRHDPVIFDRASTAISWVGITGMRLVESRSRTGWR